MNQQMHRSPYKQRGAILVMSVLFLVVLIGFAALALDFGRLYVLRSQMQNAADTAVLAAAAELDGQLGARQRAVNAAQLRIWLVEHINAVMPWIERSKDQRGLTRPREPCCGLAEYKFMR